MCLTHAPNITLIPKIQVNEDVALTFIPEHTDSSCSKHAILHTAYSSPSHKAYVGDCELNISRNEQSPEDRKLSMRPARKTMFLRERQAQVPIREETRSMVWGIRLSEMYRIQV